MKPSKYALLALAFLTATLFSAQLAAQPVRPVVDTPYPGTLTVQVDATDLNHRIFRVKQTVPVRAGPLTLFYPRWLPGNHGPSGVVARLAGLKISAQSQAVPWQRDPLDVHAFTLTVPRGVTQLDIEFEHLSPVGRESGNSSGRTVVTPDMLNLQWNAVLLYPAGHTDRQIMVKPSLRLPEGWSAATALQVAGRSGEVTDFQPVSVQTLIDSPVFAGKHMQRIDLDSDALAQKRPAVFLNVMADVASELAADVAAKPEPLAAHRALVTQADRLFGARPFARYEFLLAVSDQLGGIGLEHAQSSENAVPLGYFADWAKSSIERTLLPHEYVHAWNGKFRRPADLTTPNTNTPMQNSLLWMYEGQTQFWGEVLAVRSGLISMDNARDSLAVVAAYLDAQSGRTWRNLQDTTNHPIVAGRVSSDWRDWQRGGDYYDEMTLVWIEADMLIRSATNNARSLDDFARSFFGDAVSRRAGDGSPLTYTFDDVVAALNQVHAHNWAAFLRERLDTNAPGAPLKGLEAAGWKLAWTEEPNAYSKALAGLRKADDFAYSLGFSVGKGDTLSNVRWGSPAFQAGLSPGVQLMAVDGRAYKADRLKAAVTDAKNAAKNAAKDTTNASGLPIALLVKDGEVFKTVSITYTGGLRHPKLERIEGSEDRLSQMLAPRPE
jgi:predicted metalloprotease with PDZ domain